MKRSFAFSIDALLRTAVRMTDPETLPDSRALTSLTRHVIGMDGAIEEWGMGWM
jgi:hypothetical protein